MKTRTDLLGSRKTKRLAAQFRVRDLRENKVPINRVLTALNPHLLRVERSRNPAGWDTINPQISKWN